MEETIIIKKEKVMDYIPILLQNPRILKELSETIELIELEKVVDLVIEALKKAKEEIAIEKYKKGEITLSQLKKILNVSEWEIDKILKEHNVFRRYEL